MTDSPTDPPTGPPSDPPTEAWDAGDTGCGALIMRLAQRLDDLEPGDTLELTAHSPGAARDIPAWCRLTGHTLLNAHHPTYLIQRASE